MWLGLLAKIENLVTREFLVKHKRYNRIVGMYRQPEVGDEVKVETRLKASLVKLLLRSNEVICSPGTVNKVPTSMSVAMLRALLLRLYRDQAGGSIGKLRIILVSSANKEQEVQIDNDMRDVSFYSVIVENLVSGRLASKGMNQEIKATMSESIAALDYLKYEEVSDADMVNRLSICMANL